MAAILNPWHPLVLFLTRRLGKQFQAQVRLSMPPGSSVTLQTAPPTGMIWVIVSGTASPPRDASTGDIVHGDIYFRAEHPMLRTYTGYGRESFYNFGWPVNIEVSTGAPMVHTFVNNTALTVNWDFTEAIMECPERVYNEVYLRLWRGLYNFMLLMGGFDEGELERLLRWLKSLEYVPPPTPTERERR